MGLNPFVQLGLAESQPQWHIPDTVCFRFSGGNLQKGDTGLIELIDPYVLVSIKCLDPQVEGDRIQGFVV